jgi:hypothetical protein
MLVSVFLLDGTLFWDPHWSLLLQSAVSPPLQQHQQPQKNHQNNQPDEKKLNLNNKRRPKRKEAALLGGTHIKVETLRELWHLGTKLDENKSDEELTNDCLLEYSRNVWDEYHDKKKREEEEEERISGVTKIKKWDERGERRSLGWEMRERKYNTRLGARGW